MDSPAALRVQCLLGVAAGRGLGTWHAAEPLLLSAHTLLCERYSSTAHGEVLLVAAAYGAVMAEHGRYGVETSGMLEGACCVHTTGIRRIPGFASAPATAASDGVGHDVLRSCVLATCGCCLLLYLLFPRLAQKATIMRRKHSPFHARPYNCNRRVNSAAAFTSRVAFKLRRLQQHTQRHQQQQQQQIQGHGSAAAAAADPVAAFLLLHRRVRQQWKEAAAAAAASAAAAEPSSAAAGQAAAGVAHQQQEQQQGAVRLLVPPPHVPDSPVLPPASSCSALTSPWDAPALPAAPASAAAPAAGDSPAPGTAGSTAASAVVTAATTPAAAAAGAGTGPVGAASSNGVAWPGARHFALSDRSLLSPGAASSSVSAPPEVGPGVSAEAGAGSCSDGGGKMGGRPGSGGGVGGERTQQLGVGCKGGEDEGVLGRVDSWEVRRLGRMWSFGGVRVAYGDEGEGAGAGAGAGTGGQQGLEGVDGGRQVCQGGLVGLEREWHVAGVR